MIRASCLLFFLVVEPPLPWMSVAFATTVVIAGATLWSNPKDLDSALGGVLLLQMFGASTGYAVSASRGYFDPLLAGGRSRSQIAAGSLAAAVLPGAAAWAATALISVAAGGTARAFAGHRSLALILVSTIAWAGGLALPRMAVGALWTFVLASAALSHGALSHYMILVQSAPDGLLGVGVSAAAFAVCPFLLLGETPASANAYVMAIDACLVLLILWSGIRYVAGRDYSLVESR